MDEVLSWLNRVDLTLLRFLNADLGDARMDRFWLFVTQMHKSPIGISVMAGLLAWILYKYRRAGVRLLVVTGLAVALADTVSYRVVKHQVDRPRPFQNSMTSGWLRKIGDAQGSSFPSNHAANCFAAALVLSWYCRRGRYVFYTLALTVLLSRIMLGVHYPSDVLAGALIGSGAGWVVTRSMARCANVSKRPR